MVKEIITPAKKPVKATKPTTEKAHVNSVYKKLSDIMSECSFIEKDKENTHHKYKYLSEEAIKKHVHPLLVKHKVLFKVDAYDQQRVDTLTTANFKYTFIDTETGDELSGIFCGSGADGQDKGIWKATTGAIKYILTSIFLIPTGDDPEGTEVATAPAKAKAPAPRSNAPAPASGYPMSDKQSAFLKDLMAERSLGGLWLKEQGVTGTPNGAQCKQLITTLLELPKVEAPATGYAEDQPAPAEAKTVEYPDDEINPEDIPF
jgi:hypothetical protein